MFRPRSRRRDWAFGLAVSLFLMSAPSSGFAAGPEVGQSVPAFEAVDQSGNARDFASLAGEQGLLLLFFRSADW
ncbi:MAG: hypothetical protein F4Y47_22740 [Acidobacteriia bacterium]|nr:hypothetical protein [Terriglobia bacterium]MYG01493.1 hypothetical protein [Terriglobia bacterium]MYK08933.1 hypothetical protein [Terriglobia bacterium]